MSKPKNSKTENQENNQNNPQTTFKPEEEIEITNPALIPLINHDKKRVILELLLNQEKTIMQLSTETGWNPGTIKRHIVDLVKGNLIKESRTSLNIHRIKLKFYRVVAKHYIFHYEWPPRQ